MEHSPKWQRFRQSAREWLSALLNPRMLLCFGLAWMITNGWSYLFVFFGKMWGLRWMIIVGTAYLSFLWFPCTPEKIVTVTISLFLLRVLFPHDRATLQFLLSKKNDLRKHRIEKRTDESNGAA